MDDAPQIPQSHGQSGTPTAAWKSATQRPERCPGPGGRGKTRSGDRARSDGSDPGLQEHNAAGYGYTPQEHAAVLERFVDRLGLRHLTIMVHDWGGPIGLGFAGRRPDLVHRLIIGNTFAWPLDGERRIQIFSWVMGGPIGRALTSAFNFVPRVFFARGLAKRPSPEVLRIYFVPWQDRKRRFAAVIAPRQLIAASPYLRTVEQNLPKLADRPVLIVWGMKDFAFRDAERVFPKHKTIKLANASHFLQEDAGEQIAEEIKVFLNEST